MFDRFFGVKVVFLDGLFLFNFAFEGRELLFLGFPFQVCVHNFELLLFFLESPKIVELVFRQDPLQVLQFLIEVELFCRQACLHSFNLLHWSWLLERLLRILIDRLLLLLLNLDRRRNYR